ncbi:MULTISPECIES: hypothetical protein [Lactobacillus]|uniref:ImmA/IrrE family metallo-endopeptidase n=1 Tax=Lactobacillus mulieris TaxID=2508708 RepID=A0AAW5WYQ8_9LACO|nr:MULTISPECIES: hypothetical protein [Lactobacillus]DAS59748.1 MAG TPA: Protein of unknown function (DUF3920) [Caudoviricetes sp.]KAA9369464.1 ImmA/IrrE family metallo-endopeptidase [Lactobacillus jensenii]MCZ3622562.1 ImmA/IrrE family metallo-endopeptidase [Lactobacillus mulieris]MCZ3624200.1 ImmA/IrrE family metallo-endopeptidase [Lactobacillus mulieris]MCZ3636569.1 ImmA/IrrE family metallo-endopeptidase [Lactobacillus mulieris]
MLENCSNDLAVKNTINYLANYAIDHDIGVCLTSDLSPFIPSSSSVALRSVVINLNADNVPLQFAHELGHVLNEDDGVLYFTTSTNGSSAESNATKTGIKLLLDYYFREVPIEEINLSNFMSFYKIPLLFTDYVYSLKLQ